MMQELTISEILRGTEAGRMQSVGVMQMIPLISEDSDDRFAAPDKVAVETTGYGSMQFHNDTGKPAIIPCHAAYVVDQAAQNHAMSHVGFVNKTKKYDTAACIQQSQGGYIRRDKYDMIILPYSLREIALNKRKKRSCSKLWDAIGKFNQSLGERGIGHLEFFLTNFKKQLDEFVAEFELVENQIGAIVLIDGNVVGVERAPSHEYWRSIFTPLIRECYGSMAIQTAMSEKVTFANIPLDQRVKSLSELMENFAKVSEMQEERTKKLIRSILKDKFKVTDEEKLGDRQAHTVDNKQFAGQVVTDGVRIVYASLITKKKFFKDAKWYEKEPFEI